MGLAVLPIQHTHTQKGTDIWGGVVGRELYRRSAAREDRYYERSVNR